MHFKLWLNVYWQHHTILLGLPGIQSIPLPHTSVSSSADTRDSSVPPKATSTPYDLSFSTTTLPTETQSVKSESIDTVFITWSIIIFIAILIISVLICFCGARRLAIRGIVSNIVYVMQSKSIMYWSIMLGDEIR